MELATMIALAWAALMLTVTLVGMIVMVQRRESPSRQWEMTYRLDGTPPVYDGPVSERSREGERVRKWDREHTTS
jgi:hypothetical protein